MNKNNNNNKIMSDKTVCYVLLLISVLVLIYLWKSGKVLPVKSRLVTSRGLIYGENRGDTVIKDTPMWLTQPKNYQYLSSDPAISNWVNITPQLVDNKPLVKGDPNYTYYLSEDGLYFAQYNSSFGMFHVGRDNGSNPIATTIAWVNTNTDNSGAMILYTDKGNPYIIVTPSKNKSGEFLLHRILDSYYGSSPALTSTQ
jgi:hypothetical protein